MNYSFLEEEKESIISNDLVKNENNELDEGLKDIFRKVTKSVKDASPISTLRYAFGSDDASVIENEIYKNAKQLNSILQSNEETSKLITDALSNYYHITDQITRIARICNKIIENREDEQLFAEGVREIAKAINNIEHMVGMHGAKDVSDLTTFYKNAMNDIMNGMGKSQFKKVQSILSSLKDNVKTLLKKNNSSSQRSNNINNNSQESDSSFDNIGNDPSLNYDSDDSVDLDDFDDFDDAQVDNGVLNNGVSGQAQQSRQRSTDSSAKLATTGSSSGSRQAQQSRQRSMGSDAKLATTGSSSGSGQTQQNKQKNVDPYAQTLQLNAISKDNSDNSTSRKSDQVKRVSSDDSDKSTSRNSTHVKRVSSDVQDKSTSTKSIHVKRVSNDIQDKSTGRNSTQTKDISKDKKDLDNAKDKKGNEVFKNQVKSAENNKETKRQDTLNKEDNSNNDVKQHNKGNETKDNPEKNKKTGNQKSVSNNKSGDSDKLINYLKAHPVLKIAETN